MRLRILIQTLKVGAFLLISVATSGQQRALAHGGGIVRLTAAPAGPYLLTVWVAPKDAEAGQKVHVTTAIELDSNPVLNAEVLIQVAHAGTGAHILSAVASREQSVNKLLYEADFTIEEAGDYLIEIYISGPAGQGSNAFAIDIHPAAGISWLVVLPVSSILLLAVIGRYWRGKRRPSAQIKPS